MCDTTHSSVLAREVVCSVLLVQVDKLTIHLYCLAQCLAGGSILRRLAIISIRRCEQQCNFHYKIARFLLNMKSRKHVSLCHTSTLLNKLLSVFIIFFLLRTLFSLPMSPNTLLFILQVSVHVPSPTSIVLFSSASTMILHLLLGSYCH